MLRRLGLLAFTAIFLRGGYNQRTRAEMYSQRAQNVGVPASPDVVRAAGWAMQAAALGLQIEPLRRLSALVLALQLPIVTYIGHRFWEAEDQQREQHLTHFLKNTSLMGGALFIAATGRPEQTPPQPGRTP
jgi:putative oxidoreductase